MNVYDKIEELGIKLPPLPKRGGVYSQVKKCGNNVIYISGTGPNQTDGPVFRGKAGKEYSIEEAGIAAKFAMLNLLACLQNGIGDLNRVRSFVKILGFVSSADDFFNQPEVMNPASQLLIDIFGEKIGMAARSAIGINVLPGNIPVEIEAIVELLD